MRQILRVRTRDCDWFVSAPGAAMLTSQRIGGKEAEALTLINRRDGFISR
jgi:hypothetical protein